MNNNDELMHYGRQGMKWGQHIYGQVKTAKTNRRRKKNLAKARKAKAEKYKTAEERKKAINAGKIKPKDMTDDELKDRIERLKSEQRYKELMNDTKKANANKGKEFLKSAAMGPGKKIFFDTSVDIAAQTFKALGVKKVNEILREKGLGAEVVYTNNKKKN